MGALLPAKLFGMPLLVPRRADPGGGVVAVSTLENYLLLSRGQSA